MSHTYAYPRPAVTVDSLIFNIDPDNGLEILLIERAKDPFKGHWAIPGGFVDMDEDLQPAAKRELKEETGLDITKLFEVGSFAKPDRDPRGRVITIAFWGIADKKEQILKAADDASDYAWIPLKQLQKLAFDHSQIIEASIEKLKCKLLDRSFISTYFIGKAGEDKLQIVCNDLFEKAYSQNIFEYLNPIVNPTKKVNPTGLTPNFLETFFK